MSEKHKQGWERRRQKYGPTGRPPDAATNAIITDADYLARWKSKCIISETGCWLWQGFRQANGYGDVGYRGKTWRTHRIAFTLAKGPIPPGHDVCHTCDVRHCMNPDHLWSGPRILNNRDTADKFRNKNQQKTHCPSGHAYAENGRVNGLGYRGWRVCRICEKARMSSPKYLAWARAYRKKRRAQLKANAQQHGEQQ
jgi:hypothetical protein